MMLVKENGNQFNFNNDSMFKLVQTFVETVYNSRPVSLLCMVSSVCK